MPYAPMRITSEACANGCIGQGFVLELRGPGQCGLPQETWDAKPSGYAAYYCGHCRLVYLKKRRGVKLDTPVGFWDKQTDTLTPYSVV